ncbi:hypothetical protein P691DRAFT_815514 [Macrolepiota fuliginosa MF-IS2]|uniref:Uncharacterized protein n=1 Tax=Macrolepiota fuliginosa MF-IS2 TaxID=1400762 RepID=A0A9P6BWZ8_9AGAR|nr:hypothetical protein P691DRAFT_815514 [Macrolepiota fuliginosa MF-IS2]
MDDDDIVSLETCDRIMQLIYPVKDVICKYKLRSFNSICRPSILDTFPCPPTIVFIWLHLPPPFRLIQAQVPIETHIRCVHHPPNCLYCMPRPYRMGQALGL